MRLPSLFRIPRHQRFHIEPRYYDPVKEELEERRDRIRQSMKNGNDGTEYNANINFRRKSKSAPNASLLQLIIVIALLALIFGWMEFGNEIFYYLIWISLPAYFLYRLKTFRRRK